LIPFIFAGLLAVAAVVHLDKPDPETRTIVIRHHYHEDNLFPYVVSDTSYVRGDSLRIDR
jgi:hypothetical protein